MADNGKKRKPIPSQDGAPAGKRPRFPQRPHHTIPATSTSTAYSNGEIDIRKFMRAHEREIKSLENAMKAAKKGLSRRAFQDVPRELRRRTASHNPQRVPKRLRTRAKREAIEDNTPISRGKSGSGISKGKQKWLRKAGIERSRQAWERRAKTRAKKGESDVVVEPPEHIETLDEVPSGPSKRSQGGRPKHSRFPPLATPDTPPSRFRRRQINKTWLPTHLWHTKRARMTPSTEPLWRFAIPLAPVVKSYRLTHRAAALRGAVAWDTSYMATISMEGAESSIIGLLKALGFAREDGETPWLESGKAKKWRGGTRVWEGWIHEREGNPPKKIGQVAIIWCVMEAADVDKRKAFMRVHPSAFLQLWEEIIRASKVQKPAVVVEDLRFEIGSIEITGPAAAEALCSILSPVSNTSLPPGAPQTIWPVLASVTDPGVLPPNALVAFPISDPRLRDPPQSPKTWKHTTPEAQLTELLAYWPIDSTVTAAGIFDRNARLAAARSLPSQKTINRRKSAATLGQYPDSRPTDPQIPMLTYVSRTNKSWTVLLPWKCVLPVWRGIMRYPVSTGGTVRFGGLLEKRQVSFERSTPLFPFDCPGTDAGWEWELQERVEREKEWTKRPKGKRIEWTTIDLGNGKKGEVGGPWACEWERLLAGEKQTEKTTLSPFRQVPIQHAPELVMGRTPSPDYLSLPHLFTVKITMIGRGTPTTCARIYRLPPNDAELRDRWLSLKARPGPNTDGKPGESARQKPEKTDMPKHARNRALAHRLLEAPRQSYGPPKVGDDNYPMVPDEEDLIGFVTTGNYNLAEGMPTAIANLAVHRVVSSGKDLAEDGRACIVREAGRTQGRLATWDLV